MRGQVGMVKEEPVSTIIEERGVNIRAVTIVGRNAVYYAVERQVGTDWVTTWSETVEFKNAPAFRPGGRAFVLACFAQATAAELEALKR